jgi:uncharacterized protein
LPSEAAIASDGTVRPVRTETLQVRTSDGVTLVADVTSPDGPAPGAAVVCHPHPLYGGDRHNPVVATLWEALAQAGLVAVRFDFRGAGESGGSHDGGRAERLDVVAALDVAAAAAGAPSGRCPTVLAGYSFGSVVALEVLDERVAAWLAVAPPLRADGAPPSAAADPRPKRLLVAAHDQFCPPALARVVTGGWTATEVVEIPMADHFLAGAHRTVAAEAVALATRLSH